MKIINTIILLLVFKLVIAQPTYNYAYALNSNNTSGISTYSTATDAKGNVYICGFMYGTVNFDPSGTANLTASSNALPFVAKYNAAGAYQWAFNVSSTGSVGGIFNKIITDLNGNIYLISTAYAGTLDYDPSSNTNNIVSTASNTQVCVKYNANKNPSDVGFFQWAFTYGVSSGSSFQNYAMAIDKDNSLYVVGEYTGTVDFDPSANTSNLTATASYNMFVAKYDATSNPNNTPFFKWVKGNTITQTAGTTYTARCGAKSVGIDSSGNIYITGAYFAFSNVCGNSTSCDFSGTGVAGATFTMTPVLSGTCPSASYSLYYDGFVVKYNKAGIFQYAFTIGDIYDENINGIAVEPSGNFFLTGYYGGNNTSTTNSVDFDPSSNTNALADNGKASMFIAKYTNNGAYLWAKKIASNTIRYAIAPKEIVRDPANNIYITGDLTESGIDFDPDAGTANLNTAGVADIFNVKYNSNGVYQWGFSVGGTLADNSRAIAVDLTGNVIIAGYFKSTGLDFNPGAGSTNLSANASSTASYLASYKQCDAGFDKWTGTTNNAWATVTNWCTGAIPTTNQVAVIPTATSNNPVQLTTAQSVVDLVLQPSTSLNIGANMNLSGDATNVYGTISLNNSSTLTATGTVNNIGTINGSGTIISDVYNRNGSLIEPGSGIGILNINGNFTTNTGSRLNFEIAGTGSAGASNGYDRLAITGNAVLSDTIDIKWPSAAPINNTSYTIITAANITGTFSTLKLPTNVTGTLTYTATTVVFNITSVLPSTLIYFTAQKESNKVKCSWTTVNEINTSYYNVLRSLDGINYNVIGNQKANNAPENKYSFTDDINGINTKAIFYQLQTVDKDNNKAFSSVVKVNISDPLYFTISPNPASELIWISKDATSVDIYNSIGRLVLHKSSTIAGQPINISQLSYGTYVVKIMAVNGEVVAHKLLVE